MFEDSMNLAENKLLLLYILNKIKLPISNMQITEIILENNFMNYFTLQQYIVELTSANLLKHITDHGKDRLVIADNGKEVLSLFENRISKEKLSQLEEYMEHKISSIKKELTVTADYTIENKNSYLVNLIASENDTTLIDLKVSVASNKQARELCYKWKSNSSDLYTKIINALIDED
ncbi:MULTISPECIES: DUF4364 family protein [Clostridium]|uniref:DUF4364 family protein n=1 Tax=Clostridium senegalense TaxID=1465809 RepID=A0A6M0H6F2_9CLOT|nr:MULTISPECIES: DUF4364 family protein [Clostridium]NEU06310.1 DUF4364 family protein [Clostridium senegalense]